MVPNIKLKEDIRYREQRSIEFPIRIIENDKNEEINRVIFLSPTSIGIKWRDENNIIQHAGITLKHIDGFNLIFNAIKENVDKVLESDQNWAY